MNWNPVEFIVRPNISKVLRVEAIYLELPFGSGEQDWGVELYENTETEVASQEFDVMKRYEFIPNGTYETLEQAQVAAMNCLDTVEVWGEGFDKTWHISKWAYYPTDKVELSVLVTDHFEFPPDELGIPWLWASRVVYSSGGCLFDFSVSQHYYGQFEGYDDAKDAQEAAENWYRLEGQQMMDTVLGWNK